MGDIEYSQMRFYWDVVQSLLLLGVAVYSWIVGRAKANRASIDLVSETQTLLAKKVELLEKEVSHLPDHRDMSQIHEKINDVAGTLNKMGGELRSVNRTMSLINEYLINNK